jgi:hypothetical protein
MGLRMYMGVRNILSNSRWVLITVYGPAKYNLCVDFIAELSRKCVCTTLPMIGGDFNLIRRPVEKNNNNVNHNLMDKFNMFIDMHQLQEWRRSKQRYTRSNKQINHVMVTLDKVLMTSKWEEKHPL